MRGCAVKTHEEKFSERPEKITRTKNLCCRVTFFHSTIDQPLTASHDATAFNSFQEKLQAAN